MHRVKTVTNCVIEQNFNKSVGHEGMTEGEIQDANEPYCTDVVCRKPCASMNRTQVLGTICVWVIHVCTSVAIYRWRKKTVLRCSFTEFQRFWWTHNSSVDDLSRRALSKTRWISNPIPVLRIQNMTRWRFAIRIIFLVLICLPFASKCVGWGTGKSCFYPSKIGMQKILFLPLEVRVRMVVR